MSQGTVRYAGVDSGDGGHVTKTVMQLFLEDEVIFVSSIYFKCIYYY